MSSKKNSKQTSGKTSKRKVKEAPADVAPKPEKQENATSNSKKTEERKPAGNSGKLLAVVVAAAVLLLGWYAIRGGDNSDNHDHEHHQHEHSSSENQEGQNNDQPKNVSNEQASEQNYADWTDYAWEEQGLSFKYPEGWVAAENRAMGRLYLKSHDVNLLNQRAPNDFQQLWLSYDPSEASEEREEAIKRGESRYRVIRGEVKTSTIQAGDTKINIYEYETSGGPALEAYFTNQNGQRFIATNSTEMGKDNQTNMVANLKQLLASLKVSE